MLNELTKLKKPIQSKTEQLMSMGGGMVLLRKGVTRPGIIGAVSLAIGAYTLYRGVKAYRASQNPGHGDGNMATPAGTLTDQTGSADQQTVPATPVKSPLG
ncbi:hypothetical protein [uncultured Halopseudomonas sp.]|uniref:hypothetical protein n=1 Tax=uncultured Halopseudomonas sp. TaxID=2901193 RepID=UPI0030EDF09F|tara:strand:+ start:740 stop:1042 length:303 start_codon:yes stop_codon:yes gene_type:complete